MLHFQILWKPSKKKIDILEISDFNIDLKKRLEVIEVNDPPERKPGIKVEDVDSLVNKLKNEAKVLWKF